MGPVTQVAASRFFSMLLAASGRVYGFGAGYNGELGPDHAWSTSPKPIGPLQQVWPMWCDHSRLVACLPAWALLMQSAAVAENGDVTFLHSCCGRLACHRLAASRQMVLGMRPVCQYVWFIMSCPFGGASLKV